MPFVFYVILYLKFSLSMRVLSQIRKPIEKEMADFENLFFSALQHQNPILSFAMQHLLQRKGKMMRPILVLLSAKMYGEITPEVLHAALSLELLHTASLVHDDVVDESGTRRGQSSVNALLDNKAAVLVGDFLLSSALEHAAKTGNLRVVQLISILGQALSDGELQQLANIDSQEINEEQYFHVIQQKTASLFAACAEIGAILSGASTENVERMREVGMAIGVCFQIRDDIFDYYDDEVGKPTGNDMKEGKLTLPVIHAVLQSESSQWKSAALKVRAGNASEEEIKDLISYTKQVGGIEYAQQKMEVIRQGIYKRIQGQGESDVEQSLCLYLDFVLRRVL